MPSGRHKKLVDTWGEDELINSMKGARNERSKDSKSKRDGERDDREKGRPREDHGSREKYRHGTRDHENGIEVRDNEREHKQERRRHKDEDDVQKRIHKKRDEERSKSGKYADDGEERKPRKDRSDNESKEGRRKHHDEEDDTESSEKMKKRKPRDETEEQRQKRKEKEREERRKIKEAMDNDTVDRDKLRSAKKVKDYDHGKDGKREDSNDKHRRRKEYRDDTRNIEDTEHRKRDEDRHRKDEKDESHKRGEKVERHRKDEKDERHRKDEKEERHRKDEKEERHRKDEKEERHRRGEKNERHRKDEKDRKDEKEYKENRKHDKRRHKKDEKDERHGNDEKEEIRKKDEKEERHKKDEKDGSRHKKKSNEDKHLEKTERCTDQQIDDTSYRLDSFGQTFCIEQTESAASNAINDGNVKKESERQQLANTNDLEDNYDDDDFEDYDDDFEEDNDGEDDESDETPATNSEYADLRRAMAEENEAATLRSLDPSISSSPSSRPSTSRTGRTFVNFVAAKQRQISDKVSQKTRKRGQELMTLLDLDFVSFDLLDMAPVNEYDLYIRSFGQSNTKQAYVQCNEDNLEREIQTDEIEVDTKWTQHPADDFKGCGGESLPEEETKFKGGDSMQLAHFLDKASRAICTLLEEEEAANHCSSSLQSSNLCFSKGFTHLNTTHAFLEAREVLQVQFHPVQTMLMLTAHSLPRLSNSKVPLSTCGLICYWNLNMPIKPQRVFSCQSSVSCCCFTKTSSVFAGTVDGSVVAWDLREPSNMHSSVPLTEGMVEVQSPTYSTDGICNDDNHHSSVVSIQAVDSITDTVQSVKDEGMAFQLASMEQNGQVNFWVVIEIEKPDISGSESDLGLVPGGKIKLMKSSTIVLKGPRRDVSQLSVRHLHFSQTDANHFYVATDAGYIMHCTRNGTADIPRLYHTNIDFPVDILTVDFHPFGLPYFLVGCRDGCIRLHHTKSEFPVITWSDSTNGMDLVTLSWSRSRPAVFYSVDITAKMFIWDLLKSDSNPIRTEQFNKRLKCLSLSNDHTATRTARSEREPEIALSNEKGTVEIHRLNEQFSKADEGELTQCKQLLQSLM